MKRQEILRAYDCMTPSPAARVRMLNNILSENDRRRIRPGGRSLRRVLILAAVITLLAAFGVTAYATGWFGLRQTSIGPHDLDYGFGRIKTVELMSMQGLAGSPEYEAAMEWQDFLDSYDQDGAILAAIGNGPTDVDPKYSEYICYTQEMADKIDEICAKYDLTLLGEPAYPEMDEEFFSLAGVGQIFQRQGDDFENDIYWGYVHPDGSFFFEGDARFTAKNASWPFPITYQFVRSVKGTFSDTVLNIGSTDEYEEWSYTTQNGVTLLLATREKQSLIIADFTHSFVVVNVLNSFVAGDIMLGERRASREDMETFAELFDFSVIP